MVELLLIKSRNLINTVNIQQNDFFLLDNS